jgi:hypothetical protein
MARNLGIRRTGYGILCISFHEEQQEFESIFQSLYNDCFHKIPEDLAQEWAIANGYQAGESLLDFYEFKVDDSQGGNLKDFICSKTRPYIQFGLHI